MKAGVLLRKAVMKVSAYVLLIGLLLCGPALGFASAQDEYVFAESYDGCADACCIGNDTDCKHECPNHADCDCPEDGDGDPTGSEDDNNGKYPIDTTVPWYQYPELTESGNLILTFIYTGELDDLWVWRSDDEGENWTPYWNTAGSGTANGQITVTSERPEGDYLYMTIPDAAAEFPAETLLVFETQHPEIVCVMYINLELEFGWVDTLGKGGDRTGVDKFPRPPKDGDDGEESGENGGGDKNPPYGAHKPPADEPDTNGEIPSGTGTTPENQLSPTEVIDPTVRSERNAPYTSAVPGAMASDAYPSASNAYPSAPNAYPPTSDTADTAPDAVPKSAPPAEENTTTPAASSDRAFTATAIIGIAAALLAGAGVWVKRRRLRSR